MAQPSHAVRPRLDPVWTLLVILGLAMCVALWRIGAAGDGHAPVSLLHSRIDPNTASWQELMALPDIGEATARKIVAYREANAARTPVFRSPADLDRVPDIGPKTVARIAPHLRLDEPARP